MKKLLRYIVAVIFVTNAAMAQTPPSLGTAANFILFSTNGAVTNTGLSNLIGNVGSNNGPVTNFGNVNGQMHSGNGATAAAAADLLIAYNQLNSAIPTNFHSALLGNGDTLTKGVYFISGAASLNLTLILDAKNDPNAVFIFQVQGAFSSGAGAKVNLVNGAKACNVFWKVEGLVNLASNTIMKGTIIANNAAIILNTGDSLEGRALSTTGAVTVHGITGAKPIGCGSVALAGPAAPNLASTACYTLFSGNGAVSNTGVTYVTGDVGTNVTTTIGFDPLKVTGTIHTVPDASTAQCAVDLNNVYTYLNSVPHDIELLFPAQFGNNIVLTPHTYLLNAATTLTDTVFLDAQGNSNGVFIIKINGAFATSTYAAVILKNGAQAKNVFWKIEGAAYLEVYANFKGTLICNNGAVGLATGVNLLGRAFTTSGALSTTAINAVSLSLTTSNTNMSVCSSSLPYSWNGLTFNGPGSQTAHLTNSEGCDSAATLNLTVGNSTTSTTIFSSCTSYFWNNKTYTATGTYKDTLTNAAGCDSVASLNLTIKQATTSTSNASSCSSYTWNGKTYTATGMYKDTLTNAASCDSVATLNLTIKQPTTSNTIASNCTSYTWNGITYSATGMYKDTLTNAAGCDSVATLDLTIKQPTVSTTITSSCTSYTWNGKTYTTTGMYKDTLTNAAGCDSVATLNLTIKQATTSTSTASSCSSYTWNGKTYTVTGMYKDTLTNAASCDSVATLNLTIKQPTTSNTIASNCSSYTWNGKTYTATGMYKDTLTNAAGCDSVATLDLTIKQPTVKPIITASTTLVNAGQTGVAYTCSAVANAVSYQWTYTGNGVTIDNNGNTNITANFSPVATSGKMQVVAMSTDGCTSAKDSIAVFVTPLPVVFSSFSAVKVNNSVVINWSTATEINSRNFEVQKSIDGNNFETVGIVAANGFASKYSFVDTKPFVGINYYKLKQVDNDGKFAYSTIKAVKFDSDGQFVINIYPNPVTNILNVRVINDKAKQIRILNTLGKVLYITSTIGANGVTQIPVSNLTAGTYFVEITSNETTTVEKFVKR